MGTATIATVTSTVTTCCCVCLILVYTSVLYRRNHILQQKLNRFEKTHCFVQEEEEEEDTALEREKTQIEVRVPIQANHHENGNKNNTVSLVNSCDIEERERVISKKSNNINCSISNNVTNTIISDERIQKIRNNNNNDDDHDDSFSLSNNQKVFPLKEIGIITSPFPLRAGTPRQGLLAPHLRSILTLHSFVPKEAFDDLDQYSHVWVLFKFHLNPVPKGKRKQQKGANNNKNNNSDKNSKLQENYTFHSSKIKPPRAKGKKVGVYATRSPHRLNNVGLSLAILESIETIGQKSQKTKQTIVKLLGLDLVDGTPVYDIKPYIPSDCIQTTKASNDTTCNDENTKLQILKTPTWVSDDNDKLAMVDWTEDAKEFVIKQQQIGALAPLYPPSSSSNITYNNNEVIKSITEIIAQDPRASYDGREQSGSFEITFCTLRISFKVNVVQQHNNTTHNNIKKPKQLYALIDKVFQDPGDITACERSYQHNLAIRLMAEQDAKENNKKNKISWLYPVREGQSYKDLLAIKGGKIWDREQKNIIVKQVNNNAILSPHT